LYWTFTVLAVVLSGCSNDGGSLPAATRETRTESQVSTSPAALDEFEYAMGWASSNDTLSGWPATNATDGDTTTSYSSKSFSANQNDRGTNLFAWIDNAPATVNEVVLTARTSGTTSVCFPISYQIAVSDPAGNVWTPVGTFTTQPNSSGVAVVQLPAQYVTHGVVITPIQLTADSYGVYYFQMADVKLGLTGSSPSNTSTGANVLYVQQYGQDGKIPEAIATLKASGVKTVRLALASQNYLEFIIQAYQAGISTVALVNPWMGVTQSTCPAASQAVYQSWGYASWAIPSSLSGLSPQNFAAAFSAEMQAIEAAGVRLAAFEVGNELNQDRFDCDYVVPGTGRVLSYDDLQNGWLDKSQPPKDPEATAVANGYVDYVSVLASLKQARAALKVNDTTPIISASTANFAQPTATDGSNHDKTAGVDFVKFLRKHGLDSYVDGYGVHYYPGPATDGASTLDLSDADHAFSVCGSGTPKPCWATEWGSWATPITTCAQLDSGTLDQPNDDYVTQMREYFQRLSQQGRLANELYYSWNEGGGALLVSIPANGTTAACSGVPASSQLALSPLRTTTTYPMATSNSNSSTGAPDVLAGWPVSNLIDGKASTAYSSTSFASSQNDPWADIGAWVSDDGGPVQVNEILLTARLLNGAAMSFPAQYDILLTNAADTGWLDIGSYSVQPDATGVATISLPQTYSTWGLIVWPSVLTQDNYGVYYFQLAEVQLAYSAPE
jgi:hypothetical protein